MARKFGGGSDGADLGPGAKLMARMGFGAAEGSKGGLGIKENVRGSPWTLLCRMQHYGRSRPDCCHAHEALHMQK